MELSIIYPVHITKESRYILTRLERCLNHTTKNSNSSEHIVVLSGDRPYTEEAKKILHNIGKLQTVIDDRPSNPYSPGIARNLGIQHSSKQQLLFWDIDLLGSPKFFQQLEAHTKNVQRKPKTFYMYPCLYLTEQYTKNFYQQDLNEQTERSLLEKSYQDATQLKTNSIEHFALATSTILCNKAELEKLGNFSPEFIGHMGEDLELLNRLTINAQQYPIEEDHAVDCSSKNPSKLKGFRKHFAKYSIPHLKNEIFTVHLHHSTRIYSSYKDAKQKNLNLLKGKIIQSIQEIAPKESSPSEFKENYLNQAPKIEKNLKERLYRKTVKMIRSPKSFIKDAIKKY